MAFFFVSLVLAATVFFPLSTAVPAVGRTRGLGRRQNATYTNPILGGNYADPWVFEYEGAFYLTPTMPDGSVSILKSETLDNFNNSDPVLLWMPPNPPIWAPELHIIDGNFYIYGALQDGDDDQSHRMHVLKGTDPTNITAPYEDQGEIGTPDQNYAIDGTILQNYSGTNYFIWSGKASNDTDTVQYIYIAEMDTPTSVIGDRVEIHSPYWPNGTEKAWQWSTSSPDYGVNEGPEILQNGDQTFLIYSACGSWDDCYCLGIMGLNSSNLNPLDPNAWWANDDGPVFSGDERTVGTGHASFPFDAAGTPYIVYHGWDNGSPSGWGAREVRAQSYAFNADGTPNFPPPAASGEELPAAVEF